MTVAVARRSMPLLLWLAAAVLFFVANRAAYKGYFSDDDLSNLTWPPIVGSDVFYQGLLTPKISVSNFRPVGFLYYRFMGRTFHLNYPPYVAVLQAFHVLNVIVLFLLLGHLGFSHFAAGAGTLFYAFHAAVLEAYWKPMYIFDVLCATFCLLTLLLYIRGRWLLALVPFWLAYKSKEIAVMLPVALLAYELFLGERKWKRLTPYFLLSLSFGMQALLHNQGTPTVNSYAIHFTPDALWTTVTFYSSAILFLPFAGLALLLLPVFVRDRRLYVGIILMVSAFVPLLVLPSRLFSVYWYVPLIGLAIIIAAIASRTPRWAIALFFVLWFPLNYVMLRDKRREILALADENRWYTTALVEYARRVPPLKAVVFQGTPAHMKPWGVEGAIQNAFGFEVHPVWYLSPQAQQALEEVPMAIVGYYPVQRTVKGLLRTRNEPSSYIRFTEGIPFYQFGPGWQHMWGVKGRIATQAEVTLHRPAESKEFEIVAMREGSPSKVIVLEDERSLGTQTLSGLSYQPRRWKLTNAAPGNRRITIQTDSYIAVQAFGYVSP
jgi:hypothetical protein